MQPKQKLRWTEEENNFLKFAYPNKEFTLDEIIQAFPNRSRAAIRNQANKLGLTLYTPPKPPHGYKKCSSCDTILPLTFFHNNKHMKDGLQNQCRVCKLERYIKQKEIGYSKEIDYSKEIGYSKEKRKRCRKCNVEKPLSEFYKNSSCKDGHRNTCKTCHAKAQRIRYIKGGY